MLRTFMTVILCISISSVGLASAPEAIAKGTTLINGAPCANLTVLGLRGSDATERQMTNRPYDFNGNPDEFGIINSNSSTALTKVLPDHTTVKNEAIPYSPYDTAVFNSVEGQTEKTAEQYRESITTAVSLTRSTLLAATYKCPKSKIVVIGTEQGAQVTHEAIMNLDGRVIDRLAYVWLIGDPLRGITDKQSGGTSKGTAGIYITPPAQAPDSPLVPLLKKFAPKETAIPEYLKDKVISSCHDYDYMCYSQTGAHYVRPYEEYSTDQYTSQPANLAAEAFTTMCADITFFAARGSGEPNDGGLNSGFPVQDDASPMVDRMQGFGVTLSSMAYAIESKYPKGREPTFSYVAVDYLAISVGEAAGVNSKYPASVFSGIRLDQGPEQFRKVIKKCPTTKIVMLGYSQGGHVIHEISMALSEEERSHIASVVLVADAIRNPDDRSVLTFMGTPLKFEQDDSVIYNGMGVMRAVALADTLCLADNAFTKHVRKSNFFRRLQVAPLALCVALPFEVRFSDVVSPEKFPRDISSRILNVCSDMDTVCNTELSPDNLTMNDSVLKIWFVDKIHGEGYKRQKFYEFPASWAYSRIIRVDNMNALK